MSNVVDIRPHPATAAELEPLEAAVLEVSAYIAHHIGAARRGHSRSEQLGTLSPNVRRKRERPTPPAMSLPVTFFSIEEADADQAPALLQVARG